MRFRGAIAKRSRVHGFRSLRPLTIDAARAARQIVTRPTADGGASHRERR